MNSGALQHLDAARDARGLSWAAKFVLLALISFMGPRGIFPSQETLAAVTGLSKRKVISSLGELRARAVVHVVRAGRTSTNAYAIDFAVLTALVPLRATAETEVHHVHLAKCTTCNSEVHHVHTAKCSTCTQKDLREKEQREGTKAEPLQLLPVVPSKPSPEAEVWSHYLSVRARWRSGSRATAMSDKARREVKAQLKAGYTVDDLKLAIDGLWDDPFYRTNEYLAITYALRDTNLDKFIAQAKRALRETASLRRSQANTSPSNDVDPGRVSDGTPASRGIGEGNAVLIDPREETRESPPLDFSAFSRGA